MHHLRLPRAETSVRSREFPIWQAPEREEDLGMLTRPRDPAEFGQDRVELGRHDLVFHQRLCFEDDPCRDEVAEFALREERHEHLGVYLTGHLSSKALQVFRRRGRGQEDESVWHRAISGRAWALFTRQVDGQGDEPVGSEELWASMSPR